MEKIVYPAMDALSYARLRSVNSGYDFMGYGNYGKELFPRIAIKVKISN